MKKDELVLHCCLNQKTSPIPFIDKLDGVMYWVIECFVCGSFEISYKTKKYVIEKWNKKLLKKKKDKSFWHEQFEKRGIEIPKSRLRKYIKFRKELENERQTIEAYIAPATISQEYPSNVKVENQTGEESFSVHNTKKKSQIEKKISKEMCKLIKEEE